MTELLNTLYVQTPGTSLHLDGDTVRVYHPDQPGRLLLPLVRLDHLVLFSGVTPSDDLLLRCADDGRSVSWLTGSGRYRAGLVGPTHGNPLLRQAQHRAADSPDRKLPIAIAVVAGKIHNARQVLLRTARDTSGHRQTTLRASAELLAKRLELLATTASTDEVLGVEGIAARDYFAAMPYLLAANTDWKASGRNKRPPTDPLNCLLSFLYGMLRVAVQGALEQVGLDPYIGFLHAVRPGKPALALDLMEEFRHYSRTGSHSPCSTGGSSPRPTSKYCPTTHTGSRTQDARPSWPPGNKADSASGRTHNSAGKCPPRCSHWCRPAYSPVISAATFPHISHGRSTSHGPARNLRRRDGHTSRPTPAAQGRQDL